MRTAVAISLMILLTLVVGCKQNETETSANVESQTQVAEKSTQHDMTPEQLGELGAEIRKSPDRAKELLSDHGLDEKSFEAKIRKVTEDPEASKRYTAAYKKASA